MVVALPEGERLVTGDISTGGVGFELDECHILNRDAPVSIRLRLPEAGEVLVLQAQIRHVTFRKNAGRFWVGAEFVGLDILFENPIFRFVEESVLVALTARPRPTA